MSSALAKGRSPRKCLIIGAGPAGAAAAIAMAQQGWAVTLMDRRAGVQQKICGECLSPPSRPILARLGVWASLPVERIRRVRNFEIFGPSGRRCRLHLGEDTAFTVPRPILDQVLLSEAERMGVEVRLGVSICRIRRLPDGGFEAQSQLGEVWQADFLIGADGRHSWVAKQLGMARDEKHWLQHAAIFGHYETAEPVFSNVEMHVAPEGQRYVGINPLPGNRLNVIAVMRPGELKARLRGRGASGLADLLRDLSAGENAPPQLRHRLRGARLVSERILTVSPMAWVPTRVAGEGCALVGDAAGFIDPFTGEGLFHALESAWMLAQNAGDSARYESWHRRRFKPEEKFCLLLQRMLPYPLFTDYVVDQISKKPKLAAMLAETIADRAPTERVLTPWFWGKLLCPMPRMPTG